MLGSPCWASRQRQTEGTGHWPLAGLVADPSRERELVCQGCMVCNDRLRVSQEALMGPARVYGPSDA